MLQIRLVCNHCGHVTYYTPAISTDPLEDLSCGNCQANLCTLIRSEDKDE